MVAPTSAVLISRRDAAKTLSISERSLYSLTTEGQIPCVRLGRSVRYRPVDLEAFAEKLTQRKVG